MSPDNDQTKAEKLVLAAANRLGKKEYLLKNPNELKEAVSQVSNGIKSEHTPIQIAENTMQSVTQLLMPNATPLFNQMKLEKNNIFVQSSNSNISGVTKPQKNWGNPGQSNNVKFQNTVNIINNQQLTPQFDNFLKTQQQMTNTVQNVQPTSQKGFSTPFKTNPFQTKPIPK